MKENFVVAYQTLMNESKKNESLKWKEGSEIILFGEKVKMFQSTQSQYKNNQMLGVVNHQNCEK